MKKTVRLLSIILALVLAFSVCASAVFATSASDEDADVTYLTEEQMQALLDAQAKQSYTLADYTLSVCRIPQFGFEMKLPDFTNAISAASSDEDIYKVINVDKNSLISNGYLVYCMSDSNDYIINATYDVNDYTKMVGSYSNLTAAEKEAAVTVNKNKYQLADDEIGYVTINGVEFLQMKMTENTADEETNEPHVIESTMLTTIHNGVEYSILLRFNDLTDSDRAVVDEIRDSIKVTNGSMGYGFQGNSISKTDIVLIILCALLAMAVAALFTILYRKGLLKSDPAPAYTDEEVSEDEEFDEDIDEE